MHIGIKYLNSFIKSKTMPAKNICILILTPNLCSRDAVGNDVIQQWNTLKSKSIPVSIYAQESEPPYNDILVSLQEVEEKIKKKQTIILYHHSVYWEQGESILKKSSCRRIMRYHNITPSFYFNPYSLDYYVATNMGREQTKRLMHDIYFDKVLTCSKYSSNEIIMHGYDPEKTVAIPPFHCLRDFDTAREDEKVKKEISEKAIQVLFVGRISPHKGHRYLLHAIKAYAQSFDQDIHLHIVGKVDDKLKDYFFELQSLCNILGIENYVTFHRNVDFNALYTFYKYSDVFLIMSEHEGFGVPVLEAQYTGLPVIALDRCAVGETLGPSQIKYSTIDYLDIASAIYTLGSSSEIRDSLRDYGYLNCKRYKQDLISRKFEQVLGQYLEMRS